MGMMDLYDEDKILQYGNQQASMVNPEFQGDTDPLTLPSWTDKLGSKLFGNDAEAAGLTPRQARASRQDAIMAMAASLLQSGSRQRQRIGLGQALGAALQAGQQGSVQGIEKQSQMAGMAKAKKAEMDRQALFMRFPPPDGKDPQATAQWISTIVPHMVANGMIDDASKLAGVAKSMGVQGDFYSVDAGDQMWSYNQKTGKYEPGPMKHMSKDAKEMALLKLQEQRARTGAVQQQAQASNNRLLTNAFMGRNKMITERVPLINQARMTLDQAKIDETLTSSAIINFMQAADQKAQIRWQLLNWFKANVKQSLTGRWDMAVARNFHGKLPPDVIASMEEHLAKLEKMTIDDYEARRTGEEKRHPGLTLPGKEELGTWKPDVDMSKYNFGGTSGDSQ